VGLAWASTSRLRCERRNGVAIWRLLSTSRRVETRSPGTLSDALMARTGDLQGVQELLDRGAQLVEVLPQEECEELHLPGAVNLPLKQLDAEHANRELDDERLLVLGEVSGRGKTSGLEPGQVQTRGAVLFHIRDRKVTRQVIYFDSERALAELGLEPEAGSPRS